MEPICSWPHSQKTATDSYPEHDEFPVRTLDPWGWDWYFVPKRRYTITTWRHVIPQKTADFTMNSLNTLIYYFFKVHFDIILPYTHNSSGWLLSFEILPLLCMLHAHPPHPHSFYQFNCINIKLLIMKLSLLSCYVHSSRLKYSLQRPFLKTPSIHLDTEYKVNMLLKLSVSIYKITWCRNP
jgi:hypothetical protein